MKLVCRFGLLRLSSLCPTVQEGAQDSENQRAGKETDGCPEDATLFKSILEQFERQRGDQ